MITPWLVVVLLSKVGKDGLETKLAICHFRGLEPSVAPFTPTVTLLIHPLNSAGLSSASLTASIIIVTLIRHPRCEGVRIQATPCAKGGTRRLNGEAGNV